MLFLGTGSAEIAQLDWTRLEKVGRNAMSENKMQLQPTADQRSRIENARTANGGFKSVRLFTVPLFLEILG